MPSRITTDVSTQALIALGTSPAGPIFRHMVTVGAKVETKAKQNASGAMVGVRSGTLRSSISTQPPTVTGSRLRVVVQADAAYALAVHNGTREHVITAAPGRVLAWTGPQGPVFTRSVTIPARAGKPFLRDALSEV
jgi:hypothetical protein